MTRKDFELIAATIEALDTQGLTTAQAKIVAQRFAKALAATNPGFKPERFIKACGVVS
jgi:hypothetical protein